MKESIYKFYFLAFLNLILINFLFSDPVQLSSTRVINSDLLQHPSNTQNSLVLTAIPLDFYKSYETLTISWQPEDLSCELYYSETPGGSDLSNYYGTGVTGAGTIQQTPSQLGLGVGSYYCVVANSEHNLVSTEFRLIVESEQGVKMSQPIGSIDESVPTFSWQSNTGVPYYHIIVSDNPFVIEKDADGDLKVTGAQAIWQAITPNTSIQYGSSDPSQSSNLSAPPLVSGVQYNWIVMNNYGNALEYSSDVVTQPKEFTYEVENPIDPPQLIYPESTQEGDSTFINGDEVITFEWSEVDNAMIYEIFLSEIRLEGGSEVKYTVFNKVTTNPFIDFSARDVLVNSDYTWKVIATDQEDNSAVSDISEFSYRVSDGTLNIYVKNVDGVALSYASVEVDPIEGSSDEAPLLLGNDGGISKTLPVGTYVLTANKEGYESKKDTVEVANNDRKSVVIMLAYSPSSIYGDIVDMEGVLVNNSKVIAVNDDGEKRTSTANNGSFTLSILPGYWTIKAAKETYSSKNSIENQVVAGKNYQLDDLVISKNEKNINGTVTNTSGYPLKSVNISATNDDITIEKITNSNGNFEFIGLGFGEWAFQAEKDGYTSPSARTINITSSSPNIINLENIVLNPQANIISGNTNNSSVGLENVTITATPASGSPVTTKSDLYGNYSINLPSGDYILSASLDNYTSQSTHSLSLSVGETLDGFDFALIPNDSYIKGNVSSEEASLENATILCGNSSVTTDNLGDYSISVTPGTYEISATKTGYSSDEKKTVSIGPGQTVSNIDFVMSPNASTLSGTVTSSGENVANASVNGYKLLSNGKKITLQSVQSNSSGDYELNLLPGDYVIWAEKNNFVCKDSLALNLIAGQDYQNNNIKIIPNIAVVSGVVKNTNDQNIRSANISIVDENDSDNEYNTVSNVSGVFSINVNPNRQYKIIANKSGYSKKEKTTDILDLNSTNNYNLTLVALSSTITGRITDEDSNKIQDANISINSENNSYSTRTDINGKYTVDMDYGNYTASVEKVGYIGTSSTINLAPGARDTLNLIIEENFSTLNGKIKNINGESIENAIVTATRSSGGGSTGKTDQNGNYKIIDLVPGSYTFTVNKTNYEEIQESDQTLPEGSTIEKNYILTPYNASLNVTVNDGSTPLASVTISAENQNTGETKSVVSNEFGKATISGLAPNTEYKVTPGKVNYSGNSKTLSLSPGEENDINFTMDLINSTLSGKVVYEYNGEDLGINEAQISALSPEGFSGNAISVSDGSFVIENLKPNQKYGISIVRNGYKDVSVDSVALVQEDQSIGNLEMLPNNKKINGIVQDQTGKPLEGASVKANSGSVLKTATTDGNGNFVITDLAAYSSYYVATATENRGWENIEKEVTIEESDVNAGNFVIKINDGKITGSILDSETNQPISSVNVSANNTTTGESWSKSSQPDGTYKLQYLSAGDYQIQLIKDSYQTKTINMKLEDREETQKNFSLVYSEPVSITGQLLDTDGRSIVGKRILVINEKQELSDTTDENGKFSFDNQVLPYSTTTLCTDLPDSFYVNAVKEINIEDSDINKNLNIDIRSAFTSGKITNAETASTLKNCEITLKKKINNQYEKISQTITESDGKYEFSNLFEGNYKIIVSRTGYEETVREFNLGDFQKLTNNFELVQIEDILSGFVNLNIAGKDEINMENIRVICKKENSIIDKDTTTLSGSFQFSGLDYNQKYKIITLKTGFKNDTTEINFNPDIKEINVSLSTYNNSIVGQVQYDSEIAPKTIIHAQDLDGYKLSVTSDEFGDYILQGLVGYYNLWANNNDTSLVSHIKTVNISSDSAVYEILNLKKASTLEGIVKYNGEGKAGANIIVENINTGKIIRGISNSQGKYTISGLRSGTYILNVHSEGFVVNENSQKITLAPGESVNVSDFTLTYIDNSITGSVINKENSQGVINAQVVLLQNSAQIDTFVTGADGNFFFPGLPDGNYRIEVSHSAYQEIDGLNVTISNGKLTPSTINFILVPKDYLIYGKVRDNNGSNINDAYIKLSNSDTTATTSSNIDGDYVLEIGKPGSFNLFVTKENYDTSASTITISNLNNSAERNAIIDPLPASICGKVFLINQSIEQSDTVKFDTVKIDLKAEELGYRKQIKLINSTDYCFDNLEVGEYELTIQAIKFIDSKNRSYSRTINNLKVTAGLDTTLDTRYFTYNPNLASIEGSITVKDEQKINKIEGARIYLLDDNKEDKLDSTHTDSQGSFSINNIEPGDYYLKVNTEYKNETFKFVSDLLQLSDSTYTFNHQFKFILSSLKIYLTEDGSKSISNAKVMISYSSRTETYLTDSRGRIQTDSIFHTDTPINIDIRKKSDSDFQYINPLPFTVIFNELKDSTLHLTLPLKFDMLQIDTTGAKESIPINLHKATNYTNEVILNYTNIDGNRNEIKMETKNEDQLSATIPAQMKSGKIQFHFSSNFKEKKITYNNKEEPYEWHISSKGIISANYSKITPDQPRFAFNDSSVFQIDVRDDLGNSLTDEINEKGTVEWTLSDTAIGELIEFKEKHTKTTFVAAESEGEGKIEAFIRLDGVNIRINTTIEVKRMRLAQISIDGPEEISNRESAYYTVSTISDSGWKMTLPIHVDTIDSFKGDLVKEQEGIRYYPDSSFLGDFEITVSATDKNYDTTITVTKETSIYQEINPNTEETVLKSGNECSLVLPDNMLKGEGTAKIFLSMSSEIPAIKSKGIQQQLESNIYDVNSDKSTTVFNQLPGINFSAPGIEEGKVGYWNNDDLSWEVINGNDLSKAKQEPNLSLNEIPGWHEYGIVAQSQSLGLQALRLAPNPFTPFDRIGDNRGLQIMFKLTSNKSRYPSVTAKIYNLKGNLVRTIAEDKAMLKGDYEGGATQTLYWDGTTDNGKVARNGRYLLHIIIKDSSGKKEYLKSVALIK